MNDDLYHKYQTIAEEHDNLAPNNIKRRDKTCFERSETLAGWGNRRNGTSYSVKEFVRMLDIAPTSKPYRDNDPLRNRNILKAFCLEEKSQAQIARDFSLSKDRVYWIARHEAALVVKAYKIKKRKEELGIS